MRCLTATKFNMIATILNRTDVYPEVGLTPLESTVPEGHYETVQDEDTGTISRIWVDDVAPVIEDPRAAPGTTTEVYTERFDIPCYARGFTELGFRSTANTETFDDGVYRAVEVIQMNFPSVYILNRRQYVTNIRSRTKSILWLEEETGQATIFEVQGVTPIFDAFGTHKENIAVLKRATNQ